MSGSMPLLLLGQHDEFSLTLLMVLLLTETFGINQQTVHELELYLLMGNV